MKKIIKHIFQFFNIELKRISNTELEKSIRPVGDFKILLEDLKNRGLKCNTVFDVGANKAEWSIILKSVYPNARCILIEPLIECIANLKDFVANHKESNYYLVAAGNDNKDQIITIWDDLYGSSLLPFEDELKKVEGKQRKIKVVKIDDLIKENNIEKPEILKVDVQGFELEALKGASSLFGITEVIILEVSLFSFDDVPEFMYINNYVVYDFPGFLRRPLDGALGQCDICFVKKDSFLRKSKRWK